MNFNVLFSTDLEAKLTSMERIMEYSDLPSESCALRDDVRTDEKLGVWTVLTDFDTSAWLLVQRCCIAHRSQCCHYRVTHGACTRHLFTECVSVKSLQCRQPLMLSACRLSSSTPHLRGTLIHKSKTLQLWPNRYIVHVLFNKNPHPYPVLTQADVTVLQDRKACCFRAAAAFSRRRLRSSNDKPQHQPGGQSRVVVPPEQWPSQGRLEFKEVVLRYRKGTDNWCYYRMAIFTDEV